MDLQLRGLKGLLGVAVGASIRNKFVERCISLEKKELKTSGMIVSNLTGTETMLNFTDKIGKNY